MFKIGEIQKAYVNRISNYGAYLSDERNGELEVLLPNKHMPKDIAVDDEIEVFIYHDSEQRLTATVQKPYLQVGQIGYLKVVDKIKSGYFMANGIDKDLFLPYNEAKGELTKGTKYLVKLLLDEKSFIMASMKIYNHLITTKNYEVDQQVSGIVYDIREEMGAFVAVDNNYHGFIPKHEMYKEIRIGASVEARVTKIRDDGKLNLSIRQKTSVQIFDDVEILMKALEENNGYLELNDDSEPEDIKRSLNMSKRAFKRAVGKLLKENRISLLEDGIQILKE